MRRVVRPAKAPDVLMTKGPKELEKAAAHMELPREGRKAFDFTLYSDNEVKAALDKLFSGKCAYCETFYSNAHPMDVEHYRPKGRIEGEPDHPGYWWIAMAWDNLLPSCIDCNRKRRQITPKVDVRQVELLDEALRYSSSAMLNSGKADIFPLAAGGKRAGGRDDPLSAEKPLLLNPCEDEPGEHLGHVFVGASPVSFIVSRQVSGGDPAFIGDQSLSLRGAKSIEVYGLNRLGLVQARSEVLRRLEFLGMVMVDLLAIAQDLETAPSHTSIHRAKQAITGLADRLLAEMRSMAQPTKPYSAMVAAWLEHFADRLEDPNNG